MSYMALYRKFRPQEFSEVKGQDHIVTTLKNQLKNDRIGHAYLFTGTRGTGKTTVAKLFAKAVNCENRQEDGSPCGECPSCRAIAEGRSMNVVEMDGASNNGVDHARSIIEEIAYPPTEGRYKVYIIDEVHMLSTGAFNALLKTIEEPPSYAIFILATTEVQKVPITILSRVQRYDFHRISIDTISARLADLMEREGVDAEEKALRYVAKVGDGSMRDSLSLLDQCIAFYPDQTLTYDNVLNVLGAVDNEVFSKILRGIMNRDVSEVIRVVDEIIIEGREIGQFVTDFTWYLRNLLLVKNIENMEDILDISTDNLKVMQEEAQKLDEAVLMRYIRVLSTLSDQLRNATQKRVMTEIAMIRLCRPQMERDNDSMIDRIRSLEQQLANGVVVAAGSAGADPATAGSTAAADLSKRPFPDARPEEVDAVLKQWNEVLSLLDPMRRQFYQTATPTATADGELLLVVDIAAGSDGSLAYSVLTSETAQQEFQQVLNNFTGANVKVRVESNQTGVPAEKLYTSGPEFFKRAEEFGMLVEEDDIEE
ncbi:MAG: DNA polymerase III subunit gamma/tau [Lachnospiraceae bacterium]|nr:DNA polymerase III subunit gamma/tau [Lachnospiraceae bacterium]